MKLSWKKIKFIILILTVSICLGISLWLHLTGWELDPATLLHRYNASLFFVLFYIGISFIPIPAPIMFIGGLVFPAVQAIFLTLIASFIFATISFYLARWLGSDFFGDLEDKYPKLKSFGVLMEENAFKALIQMRLFFLIPGEIINIYAGLSKIKFSEFISATMLASFPLIMLCVSLVRANIAGDPTIVMLSLLGLLILLIIPITNGFSLTKRK